MGHDLEKPCSPQEDDMSDHGLSAAAQGKGLPGHKSGPRRMMGRKSPERDNLEGGIPLSVLVTLGENLATLSSPLLILG